MSPWMINLLPSKRLPAHLLANACILPDRYAILPLLPKNKVIVEVGVAVGAFSQRLITECEPQHFIAIDLFRLHEFPVLWDQDTSVLFGGRTHAGYYRHRFAELIEQRKMTVLEGDSVTCLASLADESLDIVYVDADHSYESVRQELAVIKRKIRQDGLIILNDYIMNEAGYSNQPYGVIQATNEFMVAENWEMAYLALEPHMYCDVVLRKAGSIVPHAHRIARLEAQNGCLQHQLAVLRSSSSWRVTAPLRQLRRLLDQTRLWPLPQSPDTQSTANRAAPPAA